MSAILSGTRIALFVCFALMTIVFAAHEADACGCGFPLGIAAPRFKIIIKSNTPLKDLLPIPPKAPPAGKASLFGDLAKVPEIRFESDESLNGLEGTKAQIREKAAERIARQLAAINHLNAKKADHFMEELLRSRPDLAGLKG